MVDALTASSAEMCTSMLARSTVIARPFACSQIRLPCMRSPADRAKWEELCQGLLATPTDPYLRVAVLAAHPDDETIGASVLLTRCTDAAFIYLTDGAPQDRKLWSPEFRGSREEY